MNVNVYERLRIKKILSVMRLNTTGETFHRTSRKMCGITLKMHGRTVYRQNGKSFVSDPGTSVFLPFGSDYSVYYEEHGECVMAEFLCDEECEIDTEIKSMTLKSSHEIHELGYKLLRLWEQKGECPGTFALLYELIAKLGDGVTSDYSAKSKQHIIRPSVEKLLSDYANPELSVGDLAAKSGVSNVYFRKIFRECYGVAPAKYLTFLRMEKAKQLLLTDGVSVGDTAEAVGFSDVYVFSKAFKRVVGLSPTDFVRRGEI